MIKHQSPKLIICLVGVVGFGCLLQGVAQAATLEASAEDPYGVKEPSSLVGPGTEQSAQRGDDAPVDRSSDYIGTGPYALRLKVVAAESGTMLPNFRVRLFSKTRYISPAIPGPASEQGLAFTGVNGAVSIEHLPADEWRLKVSSQGYTSHVQPVTTPQDTVLEIPLKVRGARLQGRVIDGVTREPIAGVRMRVEECPLSGGGYQFCDSRRLATDQNGQFALEQLVGAAVQTYIKFEQPSYFPQQRLMEPHSTWSTELGDIALYRHSRLRGRLTDAKAQPLSRQVVYVIHESIPYTDRQAVRRVLWTSGKGSWDDEAWELMARAWRLHTGEQGQFELGPLREGRYTLVFGDLDRNVKTVELASGAVGVVELQKR